MLTGCVITFRDRYQTVKTSSTKMPETSLARCSRATLAAVAIAAVLVGCVGNALPTSSAPRSSSSPTSLSSAAPEAPSVPSEPVRFAPLAGAKPGEVTVGLKSPWSVAFAGRHALVSERDTGQIREIASDGTTREVGTVAGVKHGGEGGLLGLAIDDHKRLYAYSTGAAGSRIERYTLAGESGGFTLRDAETIVDKIPSASFHNGGRLAFGPDGMLYASVGDAGQSRNAQDLASFSGKILRMTPDGGVPADNPFPNSLVYSYGHRNVQGVSWAANGIMFASEFGQNTWDELNIITAGGNYGWPHAEGRGGGRSFIDPVQQWAPAVASPSGIAVVGGTVFIANLRGEVLRAVPVANPTTSVDYFKGSYGRIRAVTAAPDGTLWLVTGNTDGRGSPRANDDRIVRVTLVPEISP